MASISLVEQIDRLLPQTQCQQCGYAGCRPYAEAITRSEADLNQCPPGGPDTIQQLAQLLRRPALALNPAHGEYRGPQIAVIDEDVCIGCTKCLQVCPVDAIVGAAKLMHTVIRSECTGCELCLPPCPVDCISLIPRGRPWDQASRAAARQRYAARNKRLARQGPPPTSSVAKTQTNPGQIQADLAASIERVKARRGTAGGGAAG